MVREKIIINGRRVSSNKAETIIADAIDNVILSGFESSEELAKTIGVNAMYNYSLIKKVLCRLYNTYSDNYVREFKRMDYEFTAAVNVISICEKKRIIEELMNKYAMENIDRLTPDDDDDDYDLTDTELDILDLVNEK